MGAAENAKHPQVWARNKLGHIVIAFNYGWQLAGFGPTLIIPYDATGGNPDGFEFKPNCRYGVEFMHLTDPIEEVAAKLGSSQRTPLPGTETGDSTASESSPQGNVTDTPASQVVDRAGNETVKRRPKPDSNREQQCAAEEPDAGWLTNTKVSKWNSKPGQKKPIIF